MTSFLSPIVQNFKLLRECCGSHKAAAAFIGLSYTRYNEWRRHPESIPKHGLRLLEFAVCVLKQSDGFRHSNKVEKRLQ